MQTSQLLYEVQDLPLFIQELLLKYGERESVSENVTLRKFNVVTIKELNEEFGLGILQKIEGYFNSYLIHSKDEKTVITMGKYLD
jgi:hypothetical protein